MAFVSQHFPFFSVTHGRNFLFFWQGIEDARPFMLTLWQETPHPASSVGHLLPQEKARLVSLESLPSPREREGAPALLGDRVRRFHQPVRDG